MKHPHWKEQAVTAAGLALVLSLAFYLLDWHQAALSKAGAHFLNLSMNWENQIPLSPGWVWIYYTYFPFLFMPVLLSEVRREIGLFRRVALGFGIQYGVAFIFFLLIPVRMDRPVAIRGSWSENALAFLYDIDPGFNILPSLHVSNTVFVASLMWRLREPALGIPAWIGCGLITASTLLVKQHYAVDLVFGAILGAAVYWFCIRFRKVIAWMDAPRTADGLDSRRSSVNL